MKMRQIENRLSELKSIIKERDEEIMGLINISAEIELIVKKGVAPANTEITRIEKEILNIITKNNLKEKKK